MKIDNNYSANSDTYGWTLTFSEERERTKKDETKERYTFEDHTYHGTLKQCLLKYLDLSLRDSSLDGAEAQKVIDKISEVEKTIKNLKV